MIVYSVVFAGDTVGMFTSEARAISRAKQIVYHYSDNPDKVWENFLKEGYDYTNDFELRLVCDTVDTDEEEFSL